MRFLLTSRIMFDVNRVHPGIIMLCNLLAGRNFKCCSDLNFLRIKNHVYLWCDAILQIKRHKEIYSLVIKDAQPDDSGTYKVVATNAAGVESNAVTIDVSEKPATQ